jgi:ATP-dependent DNA ligase
MACSGGDLEYADKKGLWHNHNYVAQEKLDGARYIIHKDENGKVRIYSRQISKKTGFPPDKTLQLQHLAANFSSFVPNGTVIDGEVVAPGKSTFNLVTRVTGSKPERAWQIQHDEGFLLFRAFDMLAYDGRDISKETFGYRFNQLEYTVGYREIYISTVPMVTGTGKRKLYDEIIATGGEGIILKDIKAPYEQGVRAKHQVKVKTQRTFDVVFMGIELAKAETVKKGEEVATASRIAGKAGAIKIGQYVDLNMMNIEDGLFGVELERKLIEIGTVSGFDDAVRDDITTNADKYVGRVLEVKAQARFASGALQNPRFIQWRDDKNAEDCVFNKDEA